MNEHYTPTQPTEAGFYAWKEHENDPETDCFVLNDPSEAISIGLWCQLTCKATAQQRLATEVERAYREGHKHGDTRFPQHMTWLTSRAARVAKGEE
jgi:hypothetical protein